MGQSSSISEAKKNHNIAVAIPCYNEALTIAKVINDFRNVLQDVPVHIFDNNSTDDSVEIAKKEGAIVHHVRKQGKGNVMQVIFDTIDTDGLIVVDGDDTYYAEDAPKLLGPILKGEADMVVGNRLPNATDDSMRRLHQFGNKLIVSTINRIFKTGYLDILSGYRVFSRRFIKSVPLLTPGFETETELTLQALEKGLDVLEIPIRYRNRPEGSESKLRSFRDGYRIILTAGLLLRDHQPIRLFGTLSLFCFLLSALAAVLRILNFIGSVKLPNEVLTGTIIIFSPIAIVSLAIGLILNAINTRFREMNQIIGRRSKTIF
ncbi:MAG: glycosyltransferase [Nitrospirae bacterium]|nr:glycosyltransferase [Nitrospirota bacterium]MBI4847278.1 glycosyltransferase [Nitrospirota bacterium]